MTWGEIARMWATAHNVHKRIIDLPVPGSVGRAFRAGRNTTPDQSGKMTWEQYLEQEYGKPMGMSAGS